MDARGFFEKVLPPEGTGFYVGFAAKKNADPNGEPWRKQRSFDTIAKLIQFCKYWDQLGYDCYYAVAAFKLARVQDRQGGWHQRSKDNQPLLRGFHQDIDTKVSHATAKYETPADAAVDVVRFSRAHNLPLPLWVGSGGGLHIHWSFDGLLGMAEWVPLALGLKQAMVAFGIDIDLNRAADPCSVLRPPGFHHTKTGNIVVADGDGRVDLAAFEQFRTLGNESRTRPSNTTSSPLTRAILGGLRDDPSDPEIIRGRCRQFNLFGADPGQCSEPVHRAIAGVCKHCGDDGRWYIGQLAPEWRERGQRKLDRYDAGPTTCEHFASINPDGCTGCPYKDRIGSPIQLGRSDFDPGEQSTVQEGPAGPGFAIYPGRYVQKDDTIVFRTETKDGQADDQVVCPHLISVAAVHRNESRPDHFSVTLNHKRRDGVHTINMDRGALEGAHGLSDLADKGVTVYDSSHFRQFLKEQIVATERSQPDLVRYDQLGWKLRGEMPLFLGPGGLLYHGDGSISPAALSDNLAARCKAGLHAVPGGSAREWVRLTNLLFAPDYYLAWFLICSSLGSIGIPLFDDSEGGVINAMNGPTGVGKSVLMYAAANIWGRYDTVSVRYYDTPASIGLICSQLGKGVPLFADELHRIMADAQFGTQRFRQIIDMFMEGKDKHRAMPSGTEVRQQILDFCRATFIAGNEAFSDIIDANCKPIDGYAAIQRLIEFHVKSQFDHTGDDPRPLLDANAGHVAHAFLSALMKPDMLKWFRTALREEAARLWKVSGLGREQRFRVRDLAAATVAGTLAKDIGLLPQSIDLPGIGQFVIETIKPNAALAVARAPGPEMANEAFDKFFAVNVNNTLYLQGAHRPGIVQVPLNPRPRELVIRREHETNRAYTAAAAFKNYLIKTGVPFELAMEELVKNGTIVNRGKLMTLGAGTEYAAGQVRCIEFNTASLREVTNVGTSAPPVEGLRVVRSKGAAPGTDPE